MAALQETRLRKLMAGAAAEVVDLPQVVDLVRAVRRNKPAFPDNKSSKNLIYQKITNSSCFYDSLDTRSNVK
jgi:hypothetical protein